ncbi:MAG: glycoside hydrolase family 2 TIM barrel-domain containing protein, partial [Bacteroidota bacterium]
MKVKLVLLVVLCGLFYLLSSSSLGTILLPLEKRNTENFNQDWEYLPNNVKEVAALSAQASWQTVELPHTWNQWDALDLVPGYRRDAGWYRKKVVFGDVGDARRILYFEGANVSTDVYVNGQRAGGHVGGYVGFRIDITDYIKQNEENTIAVRVDNGYNPDVIPSQKADFFIYGGIVRDVWLEVVPAVHLSRIAIRTPEVSEKQAQTHLEITVNDPAAIREEYTIKSRLIEPNSGATILTHDTLAREVLGNSFPLPVLKNPRLWSPVLPQLYQLVVQLYRAGTLVDEQTETVGYRWYHFEPYGAFYLNGERLLLRGTHRHEEHAGYGAAMPNHLHRQDMEQIKAMGANFVRLGHYPQDPEVYRACDELGLIVWDELPWCRGGMGTADWQANTERLLREQIRQNYNHPSIFFWSLGNEIYWLPDFENGDDEARLNRFLTQLNDLAHAEDPGRLTAIRKYYAGADLVDVFSPSIWSGWYAGVYTNYQNTLAQNQQKYPRFLHMEYGGSSHVGRHTENPITGEGGLSDDDWAEVANQVNVKNVAKSGDWTETYIVDLFDHYLSVTETQADFAGNAQWAFKDFGTPLRPQNAIPYLNQKGLLDRSGQPKDAYYVFKSYWSDDLFAYIKSHSWTHRRGPEGKARNISVYSNCPAVALVHNGQRLAQKERVLGELPAAGLNWDIQFAEGPNELIALAYQEDRLVATDTLVLTYEYQPADKADHIALTSQKLANGNYLIEATMRDKNGRRVLDYEEELYFSSDGA